MPWTRVAGRADFAGREMFSVRCGADGPRVALYALADGVYATADRCPHLGASLTHGCVVQGYVECPMHHALFDIRTGATDGSVTDRAVQTFPVKVDGDDIFVDLPAADQ
jgi:nitrite reductase/ring-hydroxylating ferredoxin subunit